MSIDFGPDTPASGRLARYSATPLYYQLAERIRADIAEGRLPPGSLLPTEEELCRHHSLSRVTVRGALRKIEIEGCIHRVKGKGTFVSNAAVSRKTELLLIHGMNPEAHHSMQGLIAGALDRAQRDGVRLGLHADVQLDRALNSIKRGNELCTGIIFLRSADISRDRLEQAARRNIPFLVEGNAPDGYNFVNVDNRAAMHAVVDHLCGLGHRRFALVHVDAGPSDHFTCRRQAVEERLAERGCPLDSGRVATALHTEDTKTVAERACARFFAAPAASPPPTAILCESDNHAAAILRSLHRRGLRVPADISVTGFDDLAICRFTDPPLTTVRQDYLELGRTAADCVLQMMDNYVNRRVQRLVKLELVVRGSTGPAPEKNRDLCKAP
jgi:DNA-binding LacI/PurR family transcriptional regulator